MIAKPLFRLQRAGENKKLEINTPERVMPHITSKKKLEDVLAWYAHPFMKLRLPDSTFARRRYVELIRPALRWYCKKYGVAVPFWLKGNGHYDQMDPEAHKTYFGEEPLKVREFEEISQRKASTPAPAPAKPQQPPAK